MMVWADCAGFIEEGMKRNFDEVCLKAEDES